MWLGEFSAGDTIDLKFTSRGTTGIPTTLDGSPAISCYKSNGTTESTAGITLTVDFDNRTGMNHIRITTTSDSTFYADGNDFQLVVTAGTINGGSVVGEIVGHFSLRNRANLLGVWKGSVTGSPTTTTFVDTTLTQPDANFWNGRVIIFTSGTLKFQATNITAFNQTTDTLTFTALTSAPSVNDQYIIV